MFLILQISFCVFKCLILQSVDSRYEIKWYLFILQCMYMYFEFFGNKIFFIKFLNFDIYLGVGWIVCDIDDCYYKLFCWNFYISIS